MKAIRNNAGFTLIELLVVVAIIGILAAIAIPQFAAYRQRGYDAQATSDLRNAATAEEAYYATYVQYLSCTGYSDCLAKLPGLRLADATILIAMTDSGLGTFNGTSKSTLGSGITCHWDSSLGGFGGCS